MRTKAISKTELAGEAPPEPGLGWLVDEFAADEEVVKRRYSLTYSEARRTRMARLLRDWRRRVMALSSEALDEAGKIDHALLRNYISRSLRALERDTEEAERLRHTVPFGPTIIALDEARSAMTPVDPFEAGQALDQLGREITEAPTLGVDAPAILWVSELRAAIDHWAAFYSGYDPNIDWWIHESLARVRKDLGAYAERLESAARDAPTILGRPVGRHVLEEELAFDMVPYSPEELIALGEREYAWCLDEMLKASRELGCGENWKAALEMVKETYLPPGEQPAMVRGLALEAIDFVEELVTIPELAKEVWRMEMMSPEAQKTNPFFLGGETIVISYPTSAMTLDEKRMSLRGNNPNFSRATVQHELIPGHHLQMYMTARFRKYRGLFSTPFWIEGWTIYWEMLLWDLGFPQTPEERIGMLFWRMHRCVRVSFSLRFHLGELTTGECVDMLVDRVGHERLNAEGEVRRSFNGLYPPLYQAAYLIGGLQFRAIERELVGSGRMTRREFHDAILRENEMPPAIMRLALRGEAPGERHDDLPAWRFDETP